MKAVVATERDRLSVVDVELDPPRSGEVRVRMMATGVCHSDLSILNGTIPSAFPVVLGHEGAGIVEEVGEGVSHVRPGDHVVLSFIPQCGECFHCVHDEPYLCSVAPNDGNQLDGTTRVHRNGEDVRVMSFLGNMAEQAVVPGICVVPIEKDIPFQAAALVGCGITTGVGAAIKTAAVRPGSTAAVVGCGGVGPLRHPGLPHRRREADHRGRSLGREDGDGEDVRCDRHGHPGRPCAARDHGHDGRGRGGLRVRGDRAPRDHRDLHQGRAPGRNRGPRRGGAGGRAVLGELPHPAAHLQDDPRVHVRERQLQVGLPDVPRPLPARAARSRCDGDPHLCTRRSAAGRSRTSSGG